MLGPIAKLGLSSGLSTYPAFNSRKDFLESDMPVRAVQRNVQAGRERTHLNLSRCTGTPVGYTIREVFETLSSTTPKLLDCEHFIIASFLTGGKQFVWRKCFESLGNPDRDAASQMGE